MSEEKCWGLLLGTAIWSFCSASSHAQLPKTVCVSLSPLSDPCRVFTFTGTDMIKHSLHPPKHLFLLHCFRMYCFRENPQTSIALHCFAVLQASTWAWHVAVQQSRRRGQPPRYSPCATQDSKTLTQSPMPVTWADTGWSGHIQTPIYCTWPTIEPQGPLWNQFWTGHWSQVKSASLD